MDLTLILGPMASGKSLEMISRLSPLQYSAIPHAVYQSSRHVRDTLVVSRSGGSLPTQKVATLAEIDLDVEIIGVDEVHMFTPEDVEHLRRLLREKVQVVVSGIDLDHRGELFPVVKALMELGPESVVYKRAVCDVCREFTAVYTQVLRDAEPFLEDLQGAALPADGTFTYEPRCRKCFVRPRSNR